MKVDKSSAAIVHKTTMFVSSIVVVATLIVFAIWLGLRLANIGTFTVRGNSMYPTLTNGSIVALKKEPLKDNNLVMFREPDSWVELADQSTNERHAVKRLIAIPGDTVTIEHGVFSVNGREVFNANKNSYRCRGGVYMKKLQNEIMVFGDNVKQSLDSRRLYCEGYSDFLVPVANVKITGRLAF